MTDLTNLPPMFGYQETGARFLGNAKAALLADDPGLGKSRQAIEACNDLAKVFCRPLKVLVLTTKSGVLVWRNEFVKWGQVDHQVTVWNYDPLSRKDSKLLSDLQKDKFDTLILDEAHYLKSSGANRSRAVYRHLRPLADRVWLLTGTPAPNHAGELWTHLKALRPDLIKDGNGRPMSEEQFQDRYCDVAETAFGREIRGSKNVRELRGVLEKGGFFLRRRKAEVLKDLPPMIFPDVPLDPKNLPQDMKAEVKKLTGLDWSQEGEEDEDDALLAHLRSEEVHMATERRLVGLLKVPLALDWLYNELQAKGKIIVFAHHREVLDKLQAGLALYNPARIDGSTSSKDRAEAERAFQNDPACRVFLGQIIACGEALTLTAASRVAFIEASWTPTQNFQAASRAHRIGQRDNVTAYFLSLAGSIDEVIQRVLSRKAREIAELFGDV